MKPSTRRLSPRVRWLGGILSLAILVPLFGVRPAFADPVADKKSQAAQLAKEIDSRGQRVEILAEQVNAARLRADDVNAKLAKAEADMAATNAKADSVKGLLREHAIDSYVRAGQAHAITTSSGIDPSVQNGYVSSITSSQSDALDQMRMVTLQLGEERGRLTAAKKQAADALAQVQSNQTEASKAVAAEEAALAKVKGELTGLVAAEQARQEQAASAKAQSDLAARASRPTANRSSPARGTTPAAQAPVAPGAGGAIQEAQRQLGKPYRYGGAGPDSFDCSGLTMWAWGHAGVSLPHSAAAQYNSIRHVAMSDIQPGDLIFYYSDLHHVGIYVGNGQMIEAPHTGTNVRYASIYRPELVGAG
ncbi:MAG: peptidoglycan DL-endopeptidase CwlO, partial [Acidimicrobiaceae bacterium]|nr:peptidoglycan DL-endopeptidase CwlO [Acidimicrobiaceae bacterium]